MDPDPGGPKTYESGSATLILQNWPGPPPYQCSRFVTFWYRSGSGNPNLYHWITDLDLAPETALFFSGILCFFAYYRVPTYCRYMYIYVSRQRLHIIMKSQNCRNHGLFLMEGSVSENAQIITNRYPEGPKRLRNTAPYYTSNSQYESKTISLF